MQSKKKLIKKAKAKQRQQAFATKIDLEYEPNSARVARSKEMRSLEYDARTNSS